MNSDWRLPQLWLDRAAQVLGTIDHEHVWLHMPSNSDVQAFIDRWKAGDIETGIISLPGNTTDTKRFQFAAHYCTLMAFTKGRIKMERRNWTSGTWTVAAGSPTTGQAFLYFGPEPRKFNAVFKEYCSVLEVMHPLGREAAP